MHLSVAAAAYAHAGHDHGPTVSDWVLPLLVLAVGAGGYLLGAAAYAGRRHRDWSSWRTASWLAGVVVIATALSPVLADQAAQARGHMVQHLLLGMLGPLALVLGAPVTLLLGATSSTLGRRVTRILRTRAFHLLSHPVTAAVLNVGGMFVLYLTPLYALAGREAWVHHLVHVHFLAAGYLFAWSIAGPDPAPRRPGMGMRVGVLVLAAAAHSYLGKLLYARAGELPPGAGHTVAEMETAAQWMYYGGDVTELLLAAALFSAWYRRASTSRRPGDDGLGGLLGGRSDTGQRG